MRCQAKYENEARAQGFTRVAGVDEVGRGALFGPVFAAAVILSPDKPIRGLRDSKQLDRERREVLAGRIRERAVAWAVAAADAFEIDHITISATPPNSRRCAIAMHRGCVYFGEGGARRLHVSVGQCLPTIRLEKSQGLYY